MIRFILVAGLLSLALPAAGAQPSYTHSPAVRAPGDTSQAQPKAVPRLSLQNQMLLRCSAAFAIEAHRQAQGDAKALAYPPLAKRGREFFVQSTAQVMDQAGLSTDQLTAALQAQARDLLQHDQLERIMPVCIRLLGNSAD